MNLTLSSRDIATIGLTGMVSAAVVTWLLHAVFTLPPGPRDAIAFVLATLAAGLGLLYVVIRVIRAAWRS